MGNEKKDLVINFIQEMNEGFMTLNRNWQLTYSNKKAQSLFNKLLVEGSIIWEIFPEIKGTFLETNFKSAMENGDPVYFEAKHPSTEMWLNIRVHSHEEGIAIFYQEVGNEKKTSQKIAGLNAEPQERVEILMEEIKELNQELESFSYSISHDLRAPLRAIQGYTKILKEDYGLQIDKEGERMMDVIVKNAFHMENLIEDLLIFSRIGRQDLRRVNLDMNYHLKNIAEELIHKNKNQNIQVNIKPLSNIFGDEAMIKQVLNNLISNAIKFSSKEEKSVIEIGSSSDAPNTTFYFRDNGTGFNMNYYHKLFNVFQRLHGKEFDGTGIGLALVKKIIKKHGGRVWAESEEGKGATFYFSLPNLKL